MSGLARPVPWPAAALAALLSVAATSAPAVADPTPATPAPADAEPADASRDDADAELAGAAASAADPAPASDAEALAPMAPETPEPQPEVSAAAEAPPGPPPDPRPSGRASMPPGVQRTGRSLAAALARPRIGAMLDLGVPDGVTTSIVVRPVAWLRAHAGLSHNLISLGQRAGVTVAPLGWWATPSVSLEVGRFAEGNANPLARAVTGDETVSSAALQRVGYRYANARLGVELGRTWCTFYVHAGMSWLAGNIRDLGAEAMSSSTGTTTISFPSDPIVRMWTVSSRAGLVVYLAR